MPGVLRVLTRVTAWLGVSILGTLTVAKMARAAADSEMLEAGASLFSYARALHAERPETVVVNGLEFEVSSTSTSDGVRSVLDHFEATCRAVNRGMEDAGDAVRTAAPGLRRVSRAGSFDGTFRVGDEHRGIVTCLEPSRRAGDAQSLLTRIKAFLASGDLADVGEVRFVSAVQNAKTTTYVTVRTRGNLLIRRAFPKQGDAPGKDLDGVPRPAHATRRLSAWAPDGAAGAAIAVYETPAGTPLAALRSFRDALLGAGWSPRTDPRDGSRLLASQGNRRVVVAATEDREANSLVVLAL